MDAMDDNDEVLVPSKEYGGSETAKPSRRRFSLKKLFPAKLLVMLFILVAVGGTIAVAKIKPEWLGIKANENAMSQRDVDTLVDEVGKIIKLPEGEAPTIATVTDLEKVKDQAFFKNAQQGDKVLVYTGAKKAYLYRPSDNKIIEVGVVNINNEPQKGVAGDSDQISVLTPTPLPTPLAVTVTISPIPTATIVPTKAPTVIPTKVVISPTIAPTVTGY